MINATFQSYAITPCLFLQNLAKPNTFLKFGLFEADLFLKNMELCCWCRNKTLQKSCQNKMEAMLLLWKQNKSHVVDAWTIQKSCWWCQNKSYCIKMSKKVVWQIFSPSQTILWRICFHPTQVQILWLMWPCRAKIHATPPKVLLPCLTLKNLAKPNKLLGFGPSF